MVSIIIDNEGACRCIYDDDLLPLIQSLGPMSIKRASRVEPTDDGEWTADLVAGPILGPFRTRKLALEAEKAWLEEHDVPEVIE